MLRKIILVAIALLLAGMAWLFFFAEDFTVKVTEQMAQDAINAQGPVKRLGVEVELNSAVIKFQSDNTMSLQADLSAIALGYPGQIKGEFQSGIRYNMPRLYLDNIQPVAVEITTDTETENELGELKSAARKFLERQKKKVTSEEKVPTIDNIIGKNDEAFQAAITKATYAFFEIIPIYDLNNAGYKGTIASLALKDVRFFDGYAEITLSPKQALLKTLGIIGLILLVILYLLIPSLMSLVVNKGIDRITQKDP